MPRLAMDRLNSSASPVNFPVTPGGRILAALSSIALTAVAERHAGGEAEGDGRGLVLLGVRHVLRTGVFLPLGNGLQRHECAQGRRTQVEHRQVFGKALVFLLHLGNHLVLILIGCELRHVAAGVGEGEDRFDRGRGNAERGCAIAIDRHVEPRHVELDAVLDGEGHDPWDAADFPLQFEGGFVDSVAVKPHELVGVVAPDGGGFGAGTDLQHRHGVQEAETVGYRHQAAHELLYKLIDGRTLAGRFQADENEAHALVRARLNSCHIADLHDIVCV